MSNLDSSETTAIPTLTPPPMHRRLIAMFYDFAIAGTLATIVAGIMSYLLEKKGITITPDSGLTYSIFAMELLVGFLYFQWFCLHKGGSLGMFVWKIRITNLVGDRVTYSQILIRYTALLLIMLAGFLLGYKLLSFSPTTSIGVALLFLIGALLWSYINPEKLVLHEVISKTRLIDLR
jgi:uncharacterized RDD family membrane protein YckC